MVIFCPTPAIGVFPEDFNAPGSSDLRRQDRRIARGGIRNMNARHPLTCLTALLICLLLAIPADVVATSDPGDPAAACRETHCCLAGGERDSRAAADACFDV